MENTKNIHDGHRERLTDLILNAGIDNVSEIQAVESFLTFILPRGDVNPLAHRLLEKYENFGNIIEANISDLVQVKGLNERSAKKIKLFAEVISYYPSSKMTKKTNLKNSGEFLDNVEQLLRFKTTENLYIFAFGHSFNLIQKRSYSMQEVREVGISPYELYNFISSTKSSYLIIVHNHPHGTAIASPNDEQAVVYIEELIKNHNCKLLDSFVIGVDGIYSEKQRAFVRRFESIEHIINFQKQKQTN